MKYCTQCGHELGAGRTCAHCGHVAVVEPPPAPALPTSGPRYPLYADDAAEAATTMTAVRPVRPIVPVVVPRRRLTGRDAALVWGVAGLVLTLLVGLGAWLLLRDGDREPPSASAGGAADAGSLASYATATAPTTSPDGVDVAGEPVSFAAANLLDDDASTAWRMPGDGSGTELTLDFGREVVLTEVGLVNGYAKTDGSGAERVDWYAANRRVLAVEWLFDDGTAVPQELTETRSMQSVTVPQVSTSTVRLRIVEVSSPGEPVARDATPISDVSLIGTAG